MTPDCHEVMTRAWAPGPMSLPMMTLAMTLCEADDAMEIHDLLMSPKRQQNLKFPPTTR